MASEAFTEKKQNNLWRPIIFIILLVAVIILLRFWGVGEKLTDLRAWIGALVLGGHWSSS